MIKRIESGKRMSQAVIHGQTVYLAGQVAKPETRGVADQTRDILAKVDKLLAASGSSRSQILSVTVYLADMKTFDEMNSEWDAWLGSDHKPARATVEAKLAAPEYRVEIVVIAACSDGQLMM
jgi:enamine deaminase RidA (YjgF/YER057c/UK114 family)